MKQILGILLLGTVCAGCVGRRYDVRISLVESQYNEPVWVAIRVDKKTGQAWYVMRKGDPNEGLKWQPIREIPGSLPLQFRN